MKTRAVKKAQVERLQADVADLDTAFVVQFQGLTVVAVDELRRKVREANGRYQVVKNTLARRATEGTKLAALGSSFRGPTAIVTVLGEPTKVAKTLAEFAKTNPAVVVKGGVASGVVLDAAECRALADVPSREQLASKLLFLLQSPMRRLATVLSAPARDLAVVLGQVAEKKTE